MTRSAPQLQLVAFALCSGLFVGALACGIATHTEIVARAFTRAEGASSSLTSILTAHPGAWQAGAPFPDWGYMDVLGCPYDNLAETAHWAPFLDAAVEHLRTVYGSEPTQWSDAGQQFAAFVFGVAGHQVADILWHSLGVNNTDEEGFLRAMGLENYHNVWQNAHSDGDTGGDAVIAASFPLAYLSADGGWQWFVPVSDIVAVYAALNLTVDAAVLEQCTTAQLLLRAAELLALPLELNTFQDRSPFLVAELEQYFLGGIDDMAQWVAWIWADVETAVTTGTAACCWPYVTLHMSCNSSCDAMTPREWPRSRPPRYPPSLFEFVKRELIHARTERRLSVTRTPAGGAMICYRAPTSARMHDAPLPAAPTLRSTATPAPLFGSANYSHFGASLAFASVADTLYLFVGAPTAAAGLGSVSVLTCAQASCSAVTVLNGSEVGARFGQSLAVHDFDGNGFPDVAVGAPSTGAHKLTYLGAVHVFFADANMQFSPTRTITLTGSSTQYATFGWTLAAAALGANAVLFVGSPFAHAGGEQRGCIDMFSFNASRAALAARWNGEMDGAWFGASLAVSAAADGGLTLAVGAPGTRLCPADLACPVFLPGDLQAVGRIYGFAVSLSTQQLKFVLLCDEQFAQAGAALAFGQPYGVASVSCSYGDKTTVLAVALPTAQAGPYTQSGIVLLLNASRLEGTSSLSVIAPATVAALEGMQDHARFGDALVFGDVNGDGVDDMVVSETFAYVENVGNFAGAAYLLAGGTSFPRGIVPMDTRTMVGDTLGGRFGSAVALANGLVAIGAPDWSNNVGGGARFCGAVTLLPTNDSNSAAIMLS